MLKFLSISISFLIFQVVTCFLFAQVSDSVPPEKIEQLAKQFRDKTGDFSAGVYKAAQQRLEAIQKQEAQLEKHLPKEDIEKAKKLKVQLKQKIDQLNGLASSPDSMLKTLAKGPYFARLDSLETLFKYSLSNNIDNPLIKDAKQQLEKLRAEIGLFEDWENFLGDREQQWKTLLSGNNLEKLQLPKAFGKWQEEAMAYKMQVQQWKEAINDPQKLETEALKLLNKLPAFREFMSKNSELARLFGPPGGSAGVPQGTAIPGLQTRATLAQELQNRFGANALQSGGALQQQLQNGMDQLSQQQAQLNPIASIQETLSEIELPASVGRGEGLGCLSGRGEERAMLKSKTFKQRLEFGWNLQSAMRVQDFPAVRDVGLSLGYKLNPRSVAGVGIAYKFALGESWKDIEWTHEGVGLRSFIDWRLTEAGGKMFKGLWLTGGFEMNYWSRMANNAQWKELAWEKSGVVGLTKIIETNIKTAKKLKIQLLVDLTKPINFNSAQPFICRIGYCL